MTIRAIDYDGLVRKLYHCENLGVVVIENALSAEVVAGIGGELAENKRNFVSRPEHYGSTRQGLSSWDFERAVLQNYPCLAILGEHYSVLSKQIHQRLDISHNYDEIKVNSSFYPIGSPGIGPRRDNSFSVNFTAIYVISGKNEFYTAKEKTGAGEIELRANPGDLVLLRGPRQKGDSADQRPIHYVKQIKSDRYIVVFREVNFEILHQTDRHRQYNA